MKQYKLAPLIRKQQSLENEDDTLSQLPTEARMFYDAYALKAPFVGGKSKVHFLKCQIDITENNKNYTLPIPPGTGKIFTIFCIGWSNNGATTAYMDIMLQNKPNPVGGKAIVSNPSQCKFHSDSFPVGSDFSADKPYYHRDEDAINPFIASKVVDENTSFRDIQKCVQYFQIDNESVPIIQKQSAFGKCITYVMSLPNFEGDRIRESPGFMGQLCYIPSETHLSLWLQNLEAAWIAGDNPPLNLNEINVRACSAIDKVNLWLDLVIIYSTSTS